MNYWIKEIEKASKEEKSWRKKAQEVVDLYKDESEKTDKVQDAKFNILWANTEVMRPALFSSVPTPEVRRRFHDADPLGREIAKLLERALEFCVDSYDFSKFGKKAVNDYLLPGRAVARVRYIPTFEKKEERRPLKMRETVEGEVEFYDGETRVEDYEMDGDEAYTTSQVDSLVYEEVRAERVPWKFFRMEPADCWENVNWVAFGSFYARDEFEREWGVAKAAQAKYGKGQDEDKGEDHEEDKALVWEVWDKRTRKQIFVTEGVEKPLEKNDDPLELEQFFPCVEPIYAVETNDDMVPTPEYCLYQYQAEELNKLTQRILNLIEAIKARGAYPGSEHAQLSRLMTADDNELIPVEDWARFADKGAANMISWVPIEQFAKVLTILEGQRSLMVQQIYELTGVSDIMRGATDPRETAKAQMIKSQMGNRRLMSKQMDFQRFIRDLYRLKAEIIANHFSTEQLKTMTGVNITPEIEQVLRNDLLRIYRVDIETDSTIAPDIARKQEEVAAALEAMGGFMGTMAPAIQQGVISKEAVMEVMLSYLRGYRFGRKVDEALEKSAGQPPPPDPKQAEAKAEAELKQQEHQMKLKEMEQEMQIKREEAELEKQKLQVEIWALQQKTQLEIQKMNMKSQLEVAGMQQKQQQDLQYQGAANAEKLSAIKEQGKLKREADGTARTGS